MWKGSEKGLHFSKYLNGQKKLHGWVETMIRNDENLEGRVSLIAVALVADSLDCVTDREALLETQSRLLVADYLAPDEVTQAQIAMLETRLKEM